MQREPYFMKNKEWFYFDEEEFMLLRRDMLGDNIWNIKEMST